MTDRTLADLIDSLAERGDAPALIAYRRDGRDEVSYRELARRVRSLAAGLVSEGLGEGDVVGLLAPNEPLWIEAFLALARAGAIAMPLPEQMGGEELARIIPQSGCKRLITTTRHLRKLEALPAGHEVEVLLVRGSAPMDRGDPPDGVRKLADIQRSGPGELPDVGPEQTAALLYTSGTTGTPKGVPLTHANLCTNVAALVESNMASADDRVLVPLPLFHTYPLTVGVLAPLALGATIVLPGGITGPQVMSALKDANCTIMVAVPRLYEAMLDAIDRQLEGRRLIGGAVAALLQFSIQVRKRTGWRIGRTLFASLRRRIGPDLRLMASGGSRLDPEAAWRLEGLGFEVLTGYGLTETSPILTFNPPGRARIESAGLAVEGVDLRIDEEEGPEPGEGEIQARGASVFQGYWQNPEANEESFTSDGFFKTGDLGFIDDDGYLHIVGRSKELIVLSGGENIFPDEVEKVYALSPLVKEMAVLERDGRLAGLFVPVSDALQDATPDDLSGRLREEVGRLSPKLPSHARIGDLAVTARSLPRTQIGKLRRQELPPIFDQAKAGDTGEDREEVLSEEDQQLLETPPAGDIYDWLKERFEGRRLTLDSSPQLDLGLDSFDWMSLTMELEERFRVHLSEEALARVSTLRDLLSEAIDAGGERESEPGDLTPEQKKWLAPQGLAIRLLGRFLFELNRSIMKGVFRLRVAGHEHLPKEAPYLIAPNHASYLDPFAIAAALSWQDLQQVYWAGWTGILFRGPLSRLFSRAARVVPVDPKRGLTSTLALGRGVLSRDLVLVWFPEGGRSQDGRLQRFLPGAGWLIDKTRAPVVPVWIEGTYEALPADSAWPRPRRLEVRIGQPLRPEDLATDGGDERQRHGQMAERLRAAVARLGHVDPESG